MKELVLVWMSNKNIWKVYVAKEKMTRITLKYLNLKKMAHH